ncbi:MAG TPA: hypothetical protein VM580_07155, partial [Labilithrix sp.]|nr:hypothetical protein [Labilithrix sp.]
MQSLSLRVSCAAVIACAIHACSSSEGSPAGRPGPDPSTDGGGSTTEASAETDAGTVTITHETMVVGDTTHSYLLALPPGYDPNRTYPLVLSFHGNPGTAVGMAGALPFDTVSKRGAVIAYPQGQGNNWDLYTKTASNADMAFIQALPAEIQSKANIDLSRVFGFGYSGGGFFLPQFTCRFGGIFKAIAVLSGGGPDEPEMNFGKYPNGCYKCPGGPIPALVMHGKADPEVTWDSGDFTHACFATFNGCQSTLSATTPS